MAINNEINEIINQNLLTYNILVKNFGIAS